MQVVPKPEGLTKSMKTEETDKNAKQHALFKLFSTPQGKLAAVSAAIALRAIFRLIRAKGEHTKKFLDSRWAGWIFENGFVFLLTYLRAMIPDPEVVTSKDEKGNYVPIPDRIKKVVKNILLCLAGCIATEEGTMIILNVLDKYVYDHVPYFTKQRKSTNPFSRAGLFDWLDGNAYLQILGGGVALGIIESFVPKEWADDVNEAPKFSLLRFLRNFVIFRIVVDSVFYLGHRAMHVDKQFYKLIHRRHHGHYTTNITTNYHFSAPDLFIESALPMFTAMVVIRSLGIRIDRFELHLMMGYMAWYELGTHLGKPLKLISMFPPLSPFYNMIYGIDDRAIEFHETHHNRRECNYGITVWLDKLFGTEEFEFRG